MFIFSHLPKVIFQNISLFFNSVAELTLLELFLHHHKKGFRRKTKHLKQFQLISSAKPKIFRTCKNTAELLTLTGIQGQR